MLFFRVTKDEQFARLDAITFYIEVFPFDEGPFWQRVFGNGCIPGMGNIAQLLARCRERSKDGGVCEITLVV